MEPILEPELEDNTLKLTGRGGRIVLEVKPSQVNQSFIDSLTSNPAIEYNDDIHKFFKILIGYDK